MPPSARRASKLWKSAPCWRNSQPGWSRCWPRGVWQKLHIAVSVAGRRFRLCGPKLSSTADNVGAGAPNPRTKQAKTGRITARLI